MVMSVEQSVECLAGETETGENVPHCRFVYLKSHILPGLEPWPRLWEAGD
jgi:hypothetical protein